MKEKFINLDCARMAAVAMWIFLTTFKHHCNMLYRGERFGFQVEVYLNENEDIKIPKGYIYTSKERAHFVGTDKVPSFDIIVFTFEY